MSKPVPRLVWPGMVIGIAVLERLALWLFYPPVIFDDSNSYRRLAGQILGSAPFDGTRSPGYPIFLAWLGPDRTVYAVQLILGLATTLLFFYLGWLVTGNQKVGAAAALIHTLNLGQLLFEADLLAETLTTFLAMLAICGGVYLLKQETFEKVNLKNIAIALLIGLSGGLATQVRPQFIFLPFLIIFILLLQVARQNFNHEGTQSITRVPAASVQAKETLKSSSFVLSPALAGGARVVSFARPGAWWARVVKALKALWAIILAIAIPAILLTALWVNYIHTQFGVWSMSSVDGYHIIQHTGKFFEYVPDENAAIRDTFLKYRAIQIAKTGKASNTIWAAVPELQKVSGLGFYKLSRKLQDISRQLILDHPLLYLGSVFEAWFWFWSAPFYWNPDAFGVIGTWLTQLQRVLLWAANAIFIAGTFALVFQRARKILAMPPALWLTLAIIWVNSILQAIVEASENPRYSVSTQTLVVLVVVWWAWHLITAQFGAKYSEGVKPQTEQKNKQ